MTGGVLPIAGESSIGVLIKCKLYCLRPAPAGQRLHRPCSPGLAPPVFSSVGPLRALPDSVLVITPSSVSIWNGSNQGAPPWLRANGTRLPKCGAKCGQANLPVKGLN